MTTSTEGTQYMIPMVTPCSGNCDPKIPGNISGNFSVTNITDVPGGGQKEDYNWWMLLLLPMVVFGVAGNILVCMAVSMEKRLQSVTNYFLLSLAITDLLVCLIVWPFSILVEFLGYWPLDAVVCDLFVTADVLMCTSSILHLCTISLERYIAIRSPLSSRLRSKTKVRIKIALVWAASLAISSPITILGFIDEKNIFNGDQCVLSNEHFIIYGSVSAFFIPLGIMVIFFGFTIRLLRKQSRMCDPSQSKTGKVQMRRSTSSKPSMNIRRPTFLQGDMKNARRTQSCPVPSRRWVDRDNIRLQLSTSMPLSESECLCSPDSPDYKFNVAFNPDVTDTIEEEEETAVLEKPAEELEHQNNNKNCKDHNEDVFDSNSVEPSPPDSGAVSPSVETKRDAKAAGLQALVKKHHAILKSSAFTLLKKDSVRQKQAKNNVKTEQKASKVLGIVFTIFIICWSPFFIVNVMSARCSECHFEHILVTVCVWLGYVSSTLNPIIYTMFNRTFRTTFIKLLKCQYRTIQKPMRVKTIPSLNGGSGGETRDQILQIPL